MPVPTLHPRCSHFTCIILQLNSASTHSISQKVRVGWVILKRVWDTYETDILYFRCCYRLPVSKTISQDIGWSLALDSRRRMKSISAKLVFSTLSLPSRLGWALPLCSCKLHGKQHALPPGTEGWDWHYLVADLLQEKLQKRISAKLVIA